MTDWTPLNRQRHQTMRWRPRRDYLHSSGQSLVPVLLGELGQLMSAYTLAFSEQGGEYAAVAILGLGQAEHFYLGPNGQWLADYVPATLRAYPFQLLGAGENKHALCIDATQLNEDQAMPAIFADDGTMAEPVQEMLTFLQHCEQQRIATARACAALAKQALIEPWPVTLANDETVESVGKKTVQGLYRINESALNALNGDALAGLRKSGALALAYAQLLSITQLQQLPKRAQWQAKLKAHAAQVKGTAAQRSGGSGLTELFSESDGSLNFDDL